MHKSRPFRISVSVGTLVFLLNASMGGFLFFHDEGQAQAASSGPASLVKAFYSKSHPLAIFAGKDAQSVQFTCQKANAPYRCYSPSQITRAYNYLPLYNKGIQGQGQTIVIMDVSQDPTVVQDLHTFDQMFGLPDPTLNILAPYGTDPADPGIATEIALDVEYAHAAAPRATIDLLLVPAGNAQTVSDLYAAFLRGVSYAVTHKLGDVISMSYGFPEPCISSAVAQLSHQVFAQAAANHITTIDSSGDSGATVPNCTFTDYLPYQATQFPAVDPTVLDVGGTYLDTRTSGMYKGETAWAQVSTNPDNGAGGGGFSTTYALPDYQKKAGINTSGPSTGRAIPDVAYDADPRSGVIVLCSSCNAGANALLIVGGTSAGAPQWAGIIALGSQYKQESLGFINPTLYRLYARSSYKTAFHDNVIGNNTYQFTNASGNPVTMIGFAANPGWDAVTGLGSPNVARLIALIA
jgi:subtilase family serine protease